MSDYNEEFYQNRVGKVASVLTRKGSDTIIATANDFLETLTEFVKELHKINKRTIKIKDFEILTVGNYIAKYPNSDFSRKVKKQWNQRSVSSNGFNT